MCASFPTAACGLLLIGLTVTIPPAFSLTCYLVIGVPVGFLELKDVVWLCIGAILLFLGLACCRLYRWNDVRLEKWSLIRRQSIGWGDICDYTEEDRHYTLVTTAGEKMEVWGISPARRLHAIIRERIAPIRESRLAKIMETQWYEFRSKLCKSSLRLRGTRLVRDGKCESEEIDLKDVAKVETRYYSTLTDRSGRTFRIRFPVPDLHILEALVARHAEDAVWIDYLGEEPAEPRARRAYLEKKRSNVRMNSIITAVATLALAPIAALQIDDLWWDFEMGTYSYDASLLDPFRDPDFIVSWGLAVLPIGLACAAWAWVWMALRRLRRKLAELDESSGSNPL